MDARTFAALATVLRESNCETARELARLRRQLFIVRHAFLEGDRHRALRHLSLALNLPPVAARGRGPFVCGLCGDRARTVWTMAAEGRWRNVPCAGRELCGPCYRMQPR